MSNDPTFLMRVTLMTAVPIWLARLDDLPEDRQLDEAVRWAHQAADVVASKGDLLQFGGGQPGEVAAAFNSMARGIAGLSGAPGGVCFLGVLWCAQHYPTGIAATGGETICPHCLAEPDPEAPEELAVIRDEVIGTAGRFLTVQPGSRYL